MNINERYHDPRTSGPYASEPSGLLRTRAYVDLVCLAEDAAREKLLGGVKPGRAKPVMKRPTCKRACP